jgi:hypothetical protein
MSLAENSREWRELLEESGIPAVSHEASEHQALLNPTPNDPIQRRTDARQLCQ